MFDSLSSITTPTDAGKRASLQGVVTSFSPMSKEPKRRCFEGRITDGDTTLRFVGFNPQQQQQISKIAADDPISLCACSIRRSRFGNSLEVIIHDTTKISKSSKTFGTTVKPNLGSGDADTKEILLQQLEDQPSFQVVSVLAKVLEIGDTQTLTDGHQVQTIQVGDSTGLAKLALWQNFVNSVQVNKSYKFTNLMVKVYNNQCSLFTPKQTDVTINQIADLPNVLSPMRSIKRTSEIEHATVKAVAQFNSFFRCISCRDGQVLPIGDSTYGRCSDCSTAVKLDHCFRQTSALLTIHSSDNAHPLKLLAVDEQLTKIAGLPL